MKGEHCVQAVIANGVSPKLLKDGAHQFLHRCYYAAFLARGFALLRATTDRRRPRACHRQQ